MKDCINKIFIVILLMLSVGLIIYSFYLLSILTEDIPTDESALKFEVLGRTLRFDSYTGQVGDAIGGLLNPFIGMSAIIVTGLAFYMQYQANDMVRQQFERQKFENQFYEMLRLHKENVNEIEVKTADGKDVIKGREVFAELKKQLEVLLDIVESDLQINLTPQLYSKIYDDFFKGYGNKEEILWNSNYYTYSNRSLADIFEEAEENNKEYNQWKNFIDRNTSWEYVLAMDTRPLNIFFQKISDMKLRIPLLKGHQSYLAHYFRHLFHTVKFVDSRDEEIISKDEKLNYLRVLRAQLSNHEQIILFYNWLGGDRHGGAWENETNRFFTQYKMIHNLWYTEMYKNNFVKERLKELVKKYQEQGGQGDLFEIKDKIDEKFS